jgi:hypothetical protein
MSEMLDKEPRRVRRTTAPHSKKERIVVYLTPELANKAREEAKKERRSLTNYLEGIIERDLSADKEGGSDD